MFLDAAVLSVTTILKLPACLEQGFAQAESEDCGVESWTLYSAGV